MNIRLITCLSGLGLTALLATPAPAFEPMPPIMQTLLKVFPEENGRFVDEPFGSTPEMPEDARPLFETFRVVVPTPEDIEKNLARLFAASPDLPIKKITRYDQDPGAPDLPGFRGAWCQTESKEDVGFSIVTINQNRFLIWAKMGYYPAFGNDSINPTVRDQYARDVGQYLAQRDADPKNYQLEAPYPDGRGLPEWVGLLRDPKVNQWQSVTLVDSIIDLNSEISTWGVSGSTAFKPTDEMMSLIVESAPDSVICDREPEFIQADLEQLARGIQDYYIFPVTLESVDLTERTGYTTSVDRYGRVRLLPLPNPCDIGLPVECLFPGTCIVATGIVSVARLAGEAPIKSHVPVFIAPWPSRYFQYFHRESESTSIKAANDFQLRCLGHLLSALKATGMNMENVLVSKPMW